MRRYYFITLTIILSWMMSIAYATVPTLTFVLEASGDPEGNLTTYTFEEENKLSVNERWIIHAETVYKGERAGYYGSRLFDATATIDPASTDPKLNASNEILCYYMRPQVGDPGAYTGNAGKLLLRNSAITDVLDIDTEKGTLFVFELISDGSGIIRSYVTVNGQTYSYTYDKKPFVSIDGVRAGSKYDVNVMVSPLENARLLPIADLNLGEALVGGSVTKKLSASGIGLTSPITATLSGDDAAAFSVSPNGIASGEAFNITFSPTIKKIYNAIITLNSDGAEPVTAQLTGNSDFDMPVQISSGSDEHWYHIQFTRRASAFSVWSLSDTTAMIVQDSLKTAPLRDDQQWKICGDWTGGYYFVNKKDAKEIMYVTDTIVNYEETIPKDRYKVADYMGDTFDFVRIGSTNNWQFFNRENNSYVNDYQGKFICNYTKDNAGNQITFIPVGQTTGIWPSAAAITRNAFAGEKPDTSYVSVLGFNATAPIYATLSGQGKDVFKLEPSELPAGGGRIKLVFTPQEAKIYTATITLSSAGLADTTIVLTGDADQGLPQFSNGDKEIWYYIAFNRSFVKSNWVWQGQGPDGAIGQGVKAEDDQSQHWKFTGNRLETYITNRTGGQLSFNRESRANADALILAEKGDSISFDRLDGVWILRNDAFAADTETGNADAYFNDFSGYGAYINFYQRNDKGGNQVVFTKAEGSADALPSVEADNDDVIARRYYTILGYEISYPAETGIYIVKEMLASGKIRASKKLIRVH